MSYVGIDLAAAPSNTALAIIHGGGRCVVEHVSAGVEDNAIVGSISAAERVGVDIPLGWPAPFVEFLSAHAAGTVGAPESTGPEWRRELAMRTTDLEVHRRTGLTPLSVSTDRIAHPALRWAGIEARLRGLGVDTARDGSGIVCEVYPAATLRCWSLPYRGYKGMKNAGRRAELMTALSQRLPRLDWNGYQDLALADDNVLDAVLAALIAREVDLGNCTPPPAELRELTRREGWIWLPRQIATAEGT